MSSVINAPLAPTPADVMDWRPGWRAMAGKEGKENLKWAALALLGLGIALAYGVSRANPTYPDSFPQVWSSVTTALTIGAPLAGLLLGLLQTVPEQRRDLWAFLTHRPAARATLFWGKVVAGLCLYLGATLLPLLGVALWARAPGNLAAPFAWGLTLGGVGAILGGVPFYFAGLLTGLRPARWWGSRAVPVAAALTATALTLAVPEFWQAALVALAGAIVLCAAARASFLTTGVYEGQPRSGRAALGAGLYVGTCTVLIGLVAFGVTAYQTLLPAPRRSQPPTTSYQITTGGRVVRATYSPDVQAYTDMRDLNGVPVPAPKGRDGKRHWYPYPDFLFSQEAVLSPVREEAEAPYTSVNRYLPPFPGPGNSPVSGVKEQWYYDRAARQLVVYSLPTRLRSGVLGPRGFAPVPADPDGAGRFPSPLRQMTPPAFDLTALRYDHSLFLASAYLRRARRVTLGTPAEDVRQLVVLAPGGYGVDSPADPPAFAAVTDARFWLLSGTGDMLFSVARERDGDSSVNVTMTPGGGRFLFWYRAKDATQSSRVVSYDAHGAVLRRDVLPPLPDTAQDTAMPSVYLFGLGLPLLLDGGFCGFAAVGHALGVPAADNIWRTLHSMTAAERLTLELLCVMSGLTGLVSAALAWGIGRRCAYTKAGQWAWAVGAFWLGLPGVLLLLSLRDWPAREACPNCGRPRVVTRELCEHCGAPFAAPAPDGTEIFELGSDRPEAPSLAPSAER